ncbi:methyltransferase family protein [Micromonospora pisi]|uniref:Methyltransferase family protein n=1 Tax=Micromonospora pisi TaxID=589240 RepID=A0A495JSE8_9ACTN|nr:methyltransferase [Micromonospora pisi]RKR91917.1 methyltransferase family protein [Micromonospora pisi]
MTDTQSEQPKLEDIFPLFFGHAYSQVVTTAVRLGVLDQLTDGAKSAHDIAVATETHPPSLHRLLRALAALGVLTDSGDDLFELTGLGVLFCKDTPTPVHGAALMCGDPTLWQAWGALEEAVRHGDTGFHHAFGEVIWDHLRHNQRLASRIYGTMKVTTSMLAPAVLVHYDFSPFKTIVDIGGGDGSLLATVLAGTEHARGTVYDIEPALRQTRDVLTNAGVADRCDVRVGDFFESVPGGADAYLLKHILHDWDDEASVRILRNCAEAVDPGGKVLVLTSVVPDRGSVTDPMELKVLAMSDMEMMAFHSGRERTVDEFRKLFTDAGLRLGEVVSIPEHPNFHVIEALPA